MTLLSVIRGTRVKGWRSLLTRSELLAIDILDLNRGGLLAREIHGEIVRRLGFPPVSKGTLCFLLARLVEVGLLHSHKRPPYLGYHLTRRALRLLRDDERRARRRMNGEHR
jgi:hypothetical protein